MGGWEDSTKKGFIMPETTVAALILNDKDEVLLIKRTCPPFDGCLCLPGGHIDGYEEVYHAVIREVREETNLDFTDARFFFLNEEIYPERKIHNVAICYVGEGKGTLKINKESSAYGWYYIPDAAKMALAFGHEKVIRAFIMQT